MWFYSRAWTAAAEEYGKARAEKYGRIAKVGRFLQLLLAAGLMIGIVYFWHFGHRHG